MPKRYDNNRCLAFGDLHFPYAVKGWYDFLEGINTYYKPDRVICMGDLLDIYSVSSYPKDMDHPDSWTEEIKQARKDVAKLASLFPTMDILHSNHDSRVYKRSTLNGIPREFLVPYKQVIGAPEAWKFHNDLRITVDQDRSNWHFAHTINAGAAAASKQLGVSVAVGHSHTKFGATAFNNGKHNLWGVDTGCLVSDKGSPFSYNKNQIGRPIRGAVVILGGLPYLEPFK